MPSSRISFESGEQAGEYEVSIVLQRGSMIVEVQNDDDERDLSSVSKRSSSKES